MKYTAKTIKEAWEIADRLFETDYLKDDTASERAGYDVYKSTLPGSIAHINDLGNRIEVIDNEYHITNVWIETSVLTESEKSELYGYIDTFIYKIEDNFLIKLEKLGLDKVIKDLDGIVAKHIEERA